MTSSPAGLVLILLAFLGVLMGLPILLGFLAGLWERRLIWPYVGEVGTEAHESERSTDPYAPPARHHPLEATDYALAVNRVLEGGDFRHLGHFLDGKGKIYKLTYDFWLAPDRMVLVLVGGGTLAGIPLQATWLFTRLRDGRCLVTLDDPKGQDSDPTGQTDERVLANADFPELMALHRGRIEEADDVAIPYSEADPLADHRAFRAGRAATLVEQGWAKFLDPEENWWKYTVKGAFLAALRTSVREWKRALKQKDRQTIRRPGQKGFVPSDRRASGGGQWIERLRFICWVMVMMGVFGAFSRGPARTEGQLLFRLIVPTLGLLGLLVLWIVGRSRKQPATVDEEMWDVEARA